MVFLTLTIFFTVLWFFLGYDSAIDYLMTWNEATKGVGFHISTLQACALIFYISMINLHVEGLKSLRHLWEEIKIDFKVLTKFKIPYHSKWRYPAKEFKFQAYADFLYSGALALSAIFIFEFPYVFMLNWFQYNDLWFPIYLYNADPISPTLIRNVFGLLIPIYLLFYPKFFGYRFKLRVDRFLMLFTLITSIVWIGWIIYPSDIGYKSPDDIDTGFEPTVWPNQKLFPQTIYIYLNTSGYHERHNLDGWFQEDMVTHTFNIVTKYMVFISVGYLFMVRFDD
jgi:hypothetical protein